MTAPADRAELRRAVAYCVRVFLVVRIALFGLGLLATGLIPQNERVGVPGRAAPLIEGGWQNLWTAWERSDAIWYLRIATDGYSPDDTSGAFFPLFPLLVRAVSTVTGGHPLLAAYLVSNIALLIGLVLLYRLTTLELSEALARRAVLYLCVFPTGFFLFAPYTESLFLALSVGTLYAARRSRWALAAGLGLLAATSRSPGVLLALPLLIEAVLQARALASPPALAPRAPRAPRALRAQLAVLSKGAGAALATVAGLALYLGYWQRLAGDFRRPASLQQTGWGKELTPPYETLLDGARVAEQYVGDYPGGYFGIDLLVVVLVLVCSLWVALRVRPTYGAYLAVSLLVPLALVFGGRPLLSLPRIYLVLFPVTWALARFAERFRAQDAVLAVSAGLMALLAALFVSSYPIF